MESLNPIRVLHIFPPSLKTRFGGQNITWKYNFSKWNNPSVVHSVLDTSTNQIVDARDAFDFEYPVSQKLLTKWERFIWTINLFYGLIRCNKKYDLLHVHLLWWGSLLLGPWAKRKRYPIVYESILLEADNPGSILNESLGSIKVRFLQDYSGILAISAVLAEDYIQNGFDDNQVFLLMNSVDTDLFHPAGSAGDKTALRGKYGLPNKKKILLFVGSVIYRKGLDILVHAFIEAVEQEPDLHLLLVGPTNKCENPSIDEKYVKNLQHLLDQKGLAEMVTFYGLLQEREQLAELFRAADVFLFPSRMEGLGNVVLEAMATGLPVVVSQIPGLNKVINHGENGLFIPIGDVGALREAVLQLGRDASLTQKLADNSRSYVEKHHSFQAWQGSLVQMYGALVKRMAGR